MTADDDFELFGGLIATKRPAHLALLADSRYRRFFLASMTSSLGDWVGVLAILALTETILGPASRATAFGLSGVMIARILPVMVLGPVAGVYADRWDRKRTLVATDVGRGLIMAVIPFSQDFFQLFVASFAVEVLSMLFVPAKEATLPNIVPRRQLVQANQLTLTVTYGTLPLGGVLFAAFVGLNALLPDSQFLRGRPEAVAIWANALTFLLSAWLFAGMDLPRQREAAEQPRGRQEGPNAWEELKEGLRFIASRPRVRALVGGVMAAAFAAGVLFAVAKLFVSVVGAGRTGFGLLVAVTGSGMLVGLFAAVWAEGRFGKDRVFGPGIGIGGLFATVAAFMPDLWSAAAAASMMGLGAGLAFVSGYTMLQESTGDEIRGRAFAAFNTGVRVSLFASLVLAPAVVGVLGTEIGPGYRIGGVRITIALGGLIAVVGAALSARQLQRANGDRQLEFGEHDQVSSDERPGPTPSGWFVVFEGGEGAGKTTQLRLLRAAIEREGFEVVVTREPGGTELGEAVRELLLDPDGRITERTEALLYAAARAQHAEEVIRPALERGAVVLCDRYVDSSIVYQGVGRGLGEQPVQEINRWGTGDLQPDAVVLLDVEAAEGLARAGVSPDRLEGEGLPFHHVVNQAYRRLAGADPDRFLVVDASTAPEEVHAKIRDAILRLLDSEPHGDEPSPGEPAEEPDEPRDSGENVQGARSEPTADIRTAETGHIEQ
ncbi:MAG: dTMP kinase [Actinomycetota bacterium]|nr:dTMP kinase [Actinomycetota bacterium]